MSYKGEILTYVALWILWAVAMAGLVCMLAGCATEINGNLKCTGDCEVTIERSVRL